MTRALGLTGGAGYDPALLEATVAAALDGTGWALGAEPELVVDLDTLVPSGLDVLAFPLRARLVEARHPAARTAYGPEPEQWIDERAPAAAPRGVAVLVHGGFYRSKWRADLMSALAADLADGGWVAANLEYRRPDRHGWEATVDDVLAGIRTVRAHRPGLPLVVVGHSAGGQLALQAIETLEPGVVDLAVSLCGVVDLAAACERSLGEHAVELALGGTPDDQPERYARADPSALTRRTGAWLLVETDHDSTDLREMNRRLSRRDDLGRPELLEGPGDHFSVIDPAAPIWRSTLARVEQMVRPPEAGAPPRER